MANIVTTAHLYVLRLLDYGRIEEEVRVDLVNWWQCHVFAVASVEHCNCEGGRKDAGVHVKPGPTSSFVEGLEVFSGVKQLEQHLHLSKLFRVVHRENNTGAHQQSLVVPPDELLYDILKKNTCPLIIHFLTSII